MSEVVSGRSYLKLKIQTAGLIKIRTTRFHGYVADSPRLDVMLLSRLVLTKMGRNVGNPIFFSNPGPRFSSRVLSDERFMYRVSEIQKNEICVIYIL